MKKFFAVFAMVCAVALFVGCAEEPVEEEIVTEDEMFETDPATDTYVDPMMEDTAMTDMDMMDDTSMTDTTMMDDTVMTDTTNTDIE
ncbi:MAG TPA: hypothetical protein VMO47_17235 [Rhodothermales bacterium]|nr:hypothetical protein [Rhodothermales bacterium]